MTKPFVLNDESQVTAHGFIVLNSGGRFDRFRENPCMLDSHDSDSVLQVIGRWDNLRVDGTTLIADPVFDEADEDAKKIQGKVERGFVKGASMGIIINQAELREIPGKGFVPVVTDWELLEGSPVGVPSNAKSLRLYSKDGKAILKAGEIKLSIDELIHKSTPSMEKITLSVEAAKVLNLGKEPEIQELNAAIIELSAAKATAEKALNDHVILQADTLVDGAIAAGKLTAEKRPSLHKLAISDYQQAKDLIDLMPGKETLSSKTKEGDLGKTADREGWDYMRYLKEAPKELQAMELNDNAAFVALKAAYKRA